jgi:hypothetical protein
MCGFADAFNFWMNSSKPWGEWMSIMQLTGEKTTWD